MNERPMVNRELYRRYKRGGLTKEELADFLYQMAKVTLDAQIEEMKIREEQRMEKFIRDTNRLVMASVCLVLHDKRKFGNKRLTETLTDLREIMDSYAKGYLDIEDMEDTLAKECNIILFKNREDEVNELSEQM